MTPRRFGAALPLLLCLLFRTAFAQNDAGVRRVTEETARRREFVQSLVPRLVKQDDDLVTLGLDDPVRQRRINRLLGMGDRIFSGGVESTAVAAACLDLLRLDATLARSPLADDLDRAFAYTFQSILPSIPQMQTAIGAEWPALRKASRFGRTPPFDPDPPAFGGFQNPLVSPGLTASASDVRVLLELPAEEIPAGPLVQGFAWIPGSRLIVAWGNSILILDADKPGVRKTLSRETGFRSVAVSASGEYLAGVREAGDEGVLELFRLIGDSTNTVLDRGDIDNVVFPPRGLRLAYRRGPEIVARDLEKPGVVQTAASLDTIVSGGLGWSPDGRYLLAVGADAKGGRQLAATGRCERIVWDAAGATLVSHDSDVMAWPAAWAPDGRGYAALDSSKAGLRIVRTSLTPGDSATVVALVPLGLRPAGAAWAPSGLHLAVSFGPGAMAPVLGRTGNSVETDDASDFAATRSAVAIVSTTPAPGTAQDPPAPTMTDVAWHPGGDWYASLATSIFGSALHVTSAKTGDSFTAGRSTARSPLFSSDGTRLAWLEETPPRIFVQDLSPGPPNAGRSKNEAASGLSALKEDRAVAAVRRYRNAIRLSPGDSRAYQGLGRAYLKIAGALADPWERGYFTEGAARAAFAAYELGGRQPDLRVDFLDAMARRALIAGRRRAADSAARARDRLEELPIRGYERTEGLGAAAKDLTEAVLWDPWDEGSRALLEGTLVRLAWKNPLDKDDQLRRSRN